MAFLRNIFPKTEKIQPSSLTNYIFIIYFEFMTEITVILKDADRTYRQKFEIYEDYTVSEDDTVILSCIEEAKKSFQGKPETIQIKIHLEI